MNSKIPEADIKFVKNRLMPYFEVKKVKLSWSDSDKKWPDIWCEIDGTPIITVTKEWLKQPLDERRKRLVHEFIHIGWGLQHGKYSGIVYSTYPKEDEYSRLVYQRIRSAT